MSSLLDDRPPEVSRPSLGEALEASGALVHTTLGVRRRRSPDTTGPRRASVQRVCQRKAAWRRT